MAAPRFEWDPEKARRNLDRHPVKERLVLIGRSYRNRLIVVVFTEQGETIRIISARNVTPREARDYGEGQRS